MKKVNAVLLLVGLLLSTGASAAVTTLGVQSCGDWIQERSKSDAIRGDEIWLVGYMTGVAIGTGKDFIAGTDALSIFIWMDNYCRANPLKDISRGGIELYFELKKQKNIK